MAQLVVSAAAAAAGFAIGGPTGAQIGWAVGSTLYASSQTIRNRGPLSDDLKAPKIEYGSAIPRLYGRQRVAGRPVWNSAKRPIANTTSEGGKGGPTVENTTYTYEIDVLYLLAIDSDALAVTRVWVNKKLVYTTLADSDADSLTASLETESWVEMTLFDGDPAQLPWSIYETAVGADDAIAYRHRTTVGIASLNLGATDQLPLVEFEIMTAGTGAGIEPYEVPLVPLSDYTTLSGNAGNFSLIGSPYTGVKGASRRSPVDADVITKTIPTLVECYRLRLKFYVYDEEDADPNVDDSPTFSLGAPLGPNPVSFIARREALSDSLKRPRIFIFGVGYSIGVGELTIGTWFELDVQMSGTTAAVRIEDLDGNLVAGLTIPDVGALFSASAVAFSIDNTAGLGPTWAGAFADLRLYSLGGFTPAAVDLADIVQAECALAGLDASQADTTELEGVEVTGFAALGSARAAIEALMAGYYFEAACSDKLYFRRRGGAVVATIAADDLGAGLDRASEIAFDPQKGNAEELPAQVTVRYVNLQADYDAGSEMGDRLIGPGREVRQVDLPLVLTPAQAKGRALAMVLDAQAAGTTAQISVTDDYAELEPTDPILVPDANGNTFRMRVVREAYASGVKVLDLVLDDPTALVTSGLTMETTAPAITVAPPLDTELVLLDVPLLADAYDEPGFIVAAAPAEDGSWPGAVLFRSPDGVVFSSALTFTDRAIFGTATELGDWTSGRVFDERNTVTVTVNGTLTGTTRAALAASRSLNVAAIGAHGRWEIVRFRDATLVSPGVYTLAGLLRGQFGTEWATGLHEAGDTFVLLQATGLRHLEQSLADVGLERSYKAVTIGRAVASATAQEFTDEGVALTPLSPVDARATRSGNNITVTWRRRTRRQTRYLGPLAASVPLGEESESYSVDVLDGATVLGTVTSSSPTVTFNVTTYGLVAGDPVELAIHQVSASVGRGYALEATV